MIPGLDGERNSSLVYKRGRNGHALEEICLSMTSSWLKMKMSRAACGSLHVYQLSIQDGQVHKVQVALADGCLDDTGRRVTSVKYLESPVQKLVPLMSADANWDWDNSQPRTLNKNNRIELEWYDLQTFNRVINWVISEISLFQGSHVKVLFWFPLFGY